MAEALARCGVGSLTLVDHDTVSVTNINRQLYALHSTIGRAKVQVAKERIRDINEDILVHIYETFYNEDTASLFDFQMYDYVVDAIDTVSSKLLLIETAKKYGVPIISCMGTGIKWTRFVLRSRIFLRPVCALWRKLFGRNFASEELRR